MPKHLLFKSNGKKWLDWIIKKLPLKKLQTIKLSRERIQIIARGFRSIDK